MLGTVYVQFRDGQLPTPDVDSEGKAIPLLKHDSGNSFHWAYAIAKPADTGNVADRRRNLLLAALLQAIGFKFDANNKTYTSHAYHFYFLDSPLIEPISSDLFTAFPAIPTVEDDKIKLVEPAADLAIAVADKGDLTLNDSAPVNVPKFGFDPDPVTPSFMRLADPGQTVTNPSLHLTIRLDPGLSESVKSQDWYLAVSSRLADSFTIAFTMASQPAGADDGFVLFNQKRVIPNNTDSSTEDPRHHRLAVNYGAIRYTLQDNLMADPDPDGRQLCIELFAALRMKPNPNLPVLVTVASDLLSVTFHGTPPIGSDNSHPLDDSVTVSTRLGPPCVRVTISGPMIHAPATGGETDWLPIAEPVQMKFGFEIEEINEFLQYSFSLCIPPDVFKKISWPTGGELPQLLENLERPLIYLPDQPHLKSLLPRLLFHLDELRKDINAVIPDLDFDFDFAFPEIGRPPRFPGFEIAAEPPDITVPKLKLSKLPFAKVPDLKLPQVPGASTPDFRRLKLRVRFPFSLPELESVEGFTIKFKTSLPKGLKVGDLIEVWYTGPTLPGMEINKLTPDFRIVGFDLGEFTIRLDRTIDFPFDQIKLRLWRPELFHVFRIKKFDIGSLEFELEAPELPPLPEKEISGLKWKGCLAEVLPDLDFPLTRSFLKDLLGDLPSVDFRVGIPDVAFQSLRWKLSELPKPEVAELIPAIPDLLVPAIDDFKLPIPTIPFELSLRIPKPDVEPPDFPILRLWIGIPINLADFRLPSFQDIPGIANRIYFYFPKLEESNATSEGPNPAVRQQAIDMDLFTLSIPLRENIKTPPNYESHDGYIDIGKREFVISLRDPQPEKKPGPKMLAYFPGGVEDKAVHLGLEGIEQELEKDSSDEDLKKLGRELKRRFQLELKELKSDDWPDIGPESLYLRLNASGLTLNAELLKTEVEIDTTGTGDSEKDDPDDSTGLIKPFTFAPQEKRDEELRSRIVIIDNELREAAVYATTVVPGTDDLMAQVEVALKQTKKGKLPDVIASLELERGNEAPITEFSISLLELKLKRLEMGLVWHREERDWDYSLIADGSIGFTGSADVIPDLEGLKVPSIEVIGLDLRKMSLKQVRIPLKLERPARFEILNGLFAVELGDLDLAWEWDGEKKLPIPRLLGCKLAKFSFQDPGAIEVHVKVGGLNIEFDHSLKAKIRIPSRLGLEVALGPSARFVGEVDWVDDGIERYFFAGGTVALEGLPEVTALLKFGTGLKYNGQRQINMVLFGGIDLDYPLFSGVVVRNLGAGIGLNNRLAAIPPIPSAEAMLTKIDTIHPESIDAWSFVREDGFYFSIVGKVILASNQGDPSLINAYVAMLVLSIDSNFDIAAAGKLWLACSLNGVKANLNNPALIGALFLSPRQKKLEVAVESHPDPFVEDNELVKKLFSKGRVRFSFRIAPGLVDYYLEEVAYRDQMYGVQLVFTGSYRFAVFRDSVLLRSDLSASGTLSKNLRAGPGGFDFHGEVRLAIGYGGLLSQHGAMAYAYLDASATFRVSAWIEIGFKKSFKVCGKRITISWSVKFSARAPSLELTLRGNIGLNDHASGLVGVDCQVGINFSICGYRLRVSARLAHNPEIYDEVRARVAAFERKLEAYISLLQKQELSDSGSGGAAALVATSEDNSAQTDKALQEAMKPLSLSGEPELWLRYQADDGSESRRHLLLPRTRERWLTPRFAEIESIKIVDLKTIEVRSAGHRLEPPRQNPSDVLPKIELLGLRGAGLEALNGKWELAEPADDTKFNLRTLKGDHGLDGGPFTLGKDYFGGTWFVVDDGLSEAAQDAVGQLPHMPDNVERIVVRTGKWCTITQVDEAQGQVRVITVDDETHTPDHGQRVVFRDPSKDPGKQVLDNGKNAASNVDQVRDVTYQVINLASDPKKEFRVDLQEDAEAPGKGWQVAPAMELATFWSATNRRSVIRRLAAINDPQNLLSMFESIKGAANNTAMFIESAAPSSATSEPVLPDHAAYRVVFDPRYETAERHWMPLEDQFRLPDGILSTRFRSLDEGIDDADAAELNEIREFSEARIRLIRQELHENLDQGEIEQLYEARAQLAQLAIDELGRSGGSARYGSVQPFSNQEVLAGSCLYSPSATTAKLNVTPEAAERIEAAFDANLLQVTFRFTEAKQTSQKTALVVAWSKSDRMLTVDRNLEQTPDTTTRFTLKLLEDPDFHLGYILNTSADILGADEEEETADRVFVRRAGGAAYAVKADDPETKSAASLSEGISCLPIRQEFVLDQASNGKESGERARVVVKLPLRFDQHILKEDLEAVGRLQIFRRFPWQYEPVLLRDFIIPEINFLNEPVMLEKGLPAQLQTDKQAVVVANFIPQVPVAHLPGLVVELFDSQDDNRHVARIAAAETDTGTSDLRITLDRKIAVGADEQPVMVKVNLHTAGLVVPGPFVFSDEFTIEDRQFADPDLVTYGMQPDRTKVAYSVRIAPQAEAAATTATPDAEWDPVPLHIPEPDLFPKRLAVAIPIEGLVLPDPALGLKGDVQKGQTIEFQLLAVDGESPRLATLGDRTLIAGDFELWASEFPLRQSGFYAGANTGPETETPVDNSRLTLDKVSVEDRLESVEGKFQLHVGPAIGNGPSAFRILDSSQLRSGMGYALFIRPASRAAFGLVAPLDHFLVRERPFIWDGAVRCRVVEQLERFLPSVLESVQQGSAELLPPGDFSVDDLFRDGRNALRTTWRSRSLFDGGVEIVVQDHDDSGLVVRQLCEVLEEDLFQESRRDFANSAYWDVSRNGQRERLAVTPGEKTLLLPPLEKIFLYTPDGSGDISKHELIEKLRTSFNELYKLLNGKATWQNLYTKKKNALGPAAEFLAWVYKIRKSPLNLHDPVVEQIADLFPVLIRRVFTGLAPADLNPGTDLVPLTAFAEACRKQESDFRKRLEEIDQADPSDMSTDDDGAQVFLDRDTARQLAGVIQRRSAIADDVLSLRDTSTTRSARFPADEDGLCRHSFWRKAVAEAKSLLKNERDFSTRLPNTAELHAAVKPATPKELAALLYTLYLKFHELLTRPEPLAKVVRRAAGMTEFLNKLGDSVSDDGGSIIKRPHHELLTRANESGKTEAQQTPLSNYLPDDARSHPPDQLPPPPAPRFEELSLRVGRLTTIDSNGLHQIWTANNGNLAKHPMKLFQQWKRKSASGTLAFAEDHRGLHILSLSDNKAEVWNALTGTLRRRLTKNALETVHAQFAETAQGLEVLTVDRKTGGTETVVHAWNLEQPQPRAKFFEKKKEEEGAPDPPALTCVAYAEQSRLVAAGTVDGHVVVWRDLGKGNQEQPLARWKIAHPDGRDDDSNGKVTHIAIIRLPEGVRIVVARATRLAMINPDRRVPIDRGAGRPVKFDKLDSSITSLAIDQVGLRVAIGLGSGNVIIYNDSLSDKRPIAAGSGEAPQVGFLRSSGATYLVTAGPSVDGKTVKIWDKAEHVQSLPGGMSVQGIATQFGRAQTSSTSRSALALFNLWERMGFALDIAVVDERNQLLRRSEISKIISELVRPIKDRPAIVDPEGKVNGIPHRLFTVFPQESDGDFRPLDKVGFSFAKVARVPNEFHEVCRHAGAEFVGSVAQINGAQTALVLGEDAAGLPGNVAEMALVVLTGAGQGQARSFTYEAATRTLSVAAMDVKNAVAAGDTVAIVDLRRGTPLRNLARWCNYRGVTFPWDKLGDEDHADKDLLIPTEAAVQRQLALTVVQLMHLREQARYLGSGDAEAELGNLAVPDKQAANDPDRLRTLDVEPQVERWLVVPAAAGWSHSVWPVPDRQGHRFRVAVRRVSRYEPLVRWWKKQHAPVEIPVKDELVAGMVSGTDGRTHIEFTDKRAERPTRLGAEGFIDHNLRLDIVSGPGAGQHRRIAHYDPEGKKVLVFIDPGDPWLEKVVSDASKFQILTDSPHWSLIDLPPALDPYLKEGPQPMTVYQYPRARTVGFSFQIPPEGQRALYNQISKIRTGYQGVEQTFRYQLLDRPDDSPQCIDELMRDLRYQEMSELPHPEIRYSEMPASDSSRIHLFRHERLVSLPHLPFYYRYRLDVRSLFDMRPADKDQLFEADMLPDDLNLSPLAERRPTQLQLQKPDIRLIADTEYRVDLHVSRNMDHLTQDEKIHEPFPVAVMFKPNGGTAQSITLKPGELPDFALDYGLFWRSRGGKDADIFLQVAWLRMPWSNDYVAPERFPKTFPIVTVSSGLTLASDTFWIEAPPEKSPANVVEIIENLVAGDLEPDWHQGLKIGIAAGAADLSYTDGTTEVIIAQGEQKHGLAMTKSHEISQKGDDPLTAIRLSFRKAGDSQVPQVFHRTSASIPLNLLRDGDRYAYQAVFRLHVKNDGRLFDDPERFFLQASREGIPTKPLQFKVRSEP